MNTLPLPILVRKHVRLAGELADVEARARSLAHSLGDVARQIVDAVSDRDANRIAVTVPLVGVRQTYLVDITRGSADLKIYPVPHDEHDSADESDALLATPMTDAAEIIAAGTAAQVARIEAAVGGPCPPTARESDDPACNTHVPF